MSDHLIGEETARLHERFLKTKRCESRKMMSDYRYPMPNGVRNLEDAATILAFEPIRPDHPAFAQRLDCLHRLRVAMGPDFRLLETVCTSIRNYIDELKRIGADVTSGSCKLRHRSAPRTQAGLLIADA